MSILIQKVNKKFKSFTALQDIDLEIKNGELMALLGPSGSGKTTLLRIIAGLEAADSGKIWLHGEDTQGKQLSERRIGFVFQHYALFRHMTVFENVAFGLKARPRRYRPEKKEIERRVMEFLHLLRLEQFHDRYPHQLSGGQRQRVALARALAVEPKILLLDEPFGALDAKVRQELRQWLRHLHENLDVTTLFVTHDQEEALEVADRIVVMSAGHIEQVGTPEEVYHHPTNAFVYDFLGHSNHLKGWKDPSGTWQLLEEQTLPPPGALVGNVLTRPHDAVLGREPPPHTTALRAKIVHINPAGSLVKVELQRPSGENLQAEIGPEQMEKLALKKEDAVFVYFQNMRAFGEK